MAAKSNRYSTMPSNEAENIDGGYQAQLSAEEQVDYPKLFKIANKSGSGIVSGAEAIEFFAKSGLSPNVLSEIWDIADEANVGSLDAQAFYVALKLIACRQQGKEISKPVLSTRVKVPVFDGVSIGAAPDAGKPIIQQAEREKFIRIFHASRPENGILDSEKAKRVFSRSQLPVDTLAQIWSLADSRRSGTLNQTEFVIAMYYIARCMEGKKDIPSTLPSTVYAAAAGRAPSTSPSPQISHSVAPAPRQNTVPQPMASSPIQPIARQFTGASSAFSPMISRAGTMSPSLPPSSNKWTISPEDRRKYDGFFDKIDVGKLGYIQGADAVEFFQNSRLPDSDLAHIWDLADRHERGRLSKEEFAIAMYLIHKRLKGDVLPTILPPSLLAQTQASSQPVTGSSTFVQSPPSTDHSLIDDGDHFHQFETRTTVAQANSELDTLRQNVKLGEEQQTGLNAERTSLDEQLNSIQKERAELSDRLSTLNRSQAEAKAAIAKLKDQMEVEREELRKAQDDAKRVTEELEALQAQKQEVNTEIESNRSESTRLKKSIYAKQEQSNHLRRELEKLGAFIKKDRMMLDITRRQASATDSDVAKLETALDKAKSGAPIEDVTDALPASPKLSQQPSTPSTPTESNSSGAPVRRQASNPTQRTKAAPPPPPPSSRHHQSVQEEKRNSVAMSGKKPPAPPPVAKGKGKADLAATAAAATAVAATGAAVGLAAEQSSHDDFSNSDPFDDFTRTFEAAKESTTASDFDEVFGEQATSPFAPFSEQQSFASGFDDDFAVPTSTQSLLTGKSDDTMKNDVAQETPAVKGVDSAPETIATPEVPAASAPQKQPDDSGPDDTESDSQSESSTDSESSEEDEDEDEKEADDKKSPVTEAAEPTSATAATSVDAANVSSVEESTTEPTNDRHQITTHQPEEPIIEDQKDERVESEPADTTEKQDQSVLEDTVSLPPVPVVPEETEPEQEEITVQKERPEAEDSVIEDSAPVEEEIATVTEASSVPSADTSSTVKGDEDAEPDADEHHAEQGSTSLEQAVDVPPEDAVLPETVQESTPVAHVDSEASKEENEPEQKNEPEDENKLAENVLEESKVLVANKEAQQEPVLAVEPTASNDEHEELELTPVATQSSLNEQSESVPESTITHDEKPDHDFEVIDPVSSTSSFVSEGMNVSMEQEQSPFDDFESAFSGSMSEAKVIPGSSTNDFEATFDTSFEDDFNPTFEQPQKDSPLVNEDVKDSLGDVATFADSVSFDNNAFDTAFGSIPSAHQTDLDSTFSVGSTNPAYLPNADQDTQYLHSGFSTFASALEASSAAVPGARSPSASAAQPVQEILPPSSTEEPSKSVLQNTNSNPAPVTPEQMRTSPRPPQLSEPQGLQELLNMGFSREQAIDALRRYDNDLEKATNFLLDF